MRNVLLFLTLIFAAPAISTSAALAQPKTPGIPVETLDKTPQQRVDELFVELKKSGNDKSAARVAARINERWNDSGSATVDLMMQWALKAMAEQKFDVALDFLDQATTMKPDYAEAWNRRATVHFMMHNFQKSMADIEQTLQLEPRHFGALAGMAQIFKARGDKETALALYSRILDIYPMMRPAQLEVLTISEELAGQAI